MLPLIIIYPILMKFLLIIILFLLIYNHKIILGQFKKITKKTWIFLLLIFLVGFAIRMYFIPHTHVVYFDEFEHINVAENILHSGRFCSCVDGTYNNCLYCYLMPYPAGHHTIQSIIFGIFGDSEKVAFNTNAIIASLSILLIFLLVCLLFKNQNTALWAALIFSFIPVHLKFSGTAILEISSLFFIILALIFLVMYIRLNKFPIFLLFLSILLYTLNTRPENFLLLTIILPYFLFTKKRKEFGSRRYIVAIALFLILLLPLVQLLYIGFTSSYHGWRDSLMERAINVKNNLLPNIVFWFNPFFNTTISLIFFFLGCIGIYSNNKKIFYFFSLYFILSLFACSSYAAGQILTFRDTSRYSMSFYVPLVVFASYGMDSFIKKLKFKKKFFTFLSIFILIFLCIISVLPTYNFIFYEPRHNAEYEFITSMKDKLPSDKYILSYNPPAIISTLHKRAIKPTDFLEYFEIIDPKDEIILFKDFWWYDKWESSNQIEEELRKKYDFNLISEKRIDSRQYSFYNLTIKKQQI